MKLAFSTLACVDWDLEKIAALAKQFGYHGVELRVSGNQHVDPDFSPAERKKVLETFRAKDLEIACLSAYTRFAFPERAKRDEQINELRRTIDLAHDLECPYVRTFGANAPIAGFTKEELFQWIADALQEVDAYGAERGVQVLLETHDALSTGQAVAEVLALAGEVGAGALWDVKHPLVEGESVTETIEALGSRIKHVHIKDWLHVPGLEQEKLLLLGAGELPWQEIVAKLQARGYTGYLSLEWEKLWHPEIEDSYVAIYQFASKMKQFLA